jgi:hypothetical protein
MKNVSGASNEVTQNSHGFVIGDVLKFAGGVYAKAKADTEDNAEVIGIVKEVNGDDAFTILNVGYITDLSGLVANTVYYLSDSVAGGITDTEPTTNGYISKPLLLATSTTTGYFFNMRGTVISGDLDLLCSSISTDALTLNLASSADGDMWYRNNGVFTRLAKGTSNYPMYMNAAGTAPEWAKGVFCGSFTRDLSADSGDVAYTGVGFKPSALIVMGYLGGGKTLALGMAENAHSYGIYDNHYNVADAYDGAGAYIITIFQDTGKVQQGALKTFDSDGFTITWVKTSTPGGIAGFYYIALDKEIRYG